LAASVFPQRIAETPRLARQEYDCERSDGAEAIGRPKGYGE
jgi:hypothetical protein